MAWRALARDSARPGARSATKNGAEEEGGGADEECLLEAVEEGVLGMEDQR